MAVAVAADALVAVLIGGDLDVVDGLAVGLLDGAQLGVDQQAKLVGSGGVGQVVADGAVVLHGVVAADPELDPGKGVLAVLAQVELLGSLLHLVDGGLEVGFLGVGELVEGVLQIGGVLFLGKHVEEVLADDLRVDAHELTVSALSYELPAVGVGLAAGAVEHKDLVQSLQRQIALIGSGVHLLGLGPFLRDKGVQDAGLDHLVLNLVAVLDQGHGVGANGLLGFGGELIEDLVVLGLLPVELHGVAGVDGLQVLNEHGQSTLAAAGVAHAVEGLALGLLDGLLGKLLQGHSLGLLDDFLDVALLLVGAPGPAVAAGGKQRDQHQNSQNDCQCFFHDSISFLCYEM